VYRQTRLLTAWMLSGALLFLGGCQSQADSAPEQDSTPQPVTSPETGQQRPPGELPCAAPWELVFVTPPQAVLSGSCSSEVVVRLQEPRGAPVRLDRPVTLTLSGTAVGGAFYADAACTLAISSVSIPARDSTVRFFFKEDTAGSPVHEVSAAGLIHATQTQRVTDSRPPPGPPSEPLGSTCRLQFPPAAGIPCAIATPGTQYYVSATRGSDGNPGTSPDKPWATLGHAVQAAPGGTVRVAAGTYTGPTLSLGRSLTVKGGFDDSFSSWDPDRYPTTYTGPVSLSHDGAVLGGFRLVARAANLGWAPSWHTVRAGTFIRNYVELVYTANDPNHITAVNAGASEGRTVRVQCNDIYIRGSSGSPLGTHALTFDANSGRAEASSNRICADHNPSIWVNYAISGYGSCSSSAGAASVTLTNNVIEVMQREWSQGPIWGVHFYGCHSDMDVILTNNTVLSSGTGLGGYSGEGGATIRWKLTNNIIFSEGSRGSAADVGTTRIVSSGNNLFFGYASNTPRPAPASSTGDDTSGTAVMGTVFQDAARGDFRPRAGGPAVGTGLNVHGLGTHGSVTTDLAQQPRPPDGAWDRGALRY